MISTQPLFSQDHAELITEKYLRSEFTFHESTKMKYSECIEKTHMTCTYVWGVITPKSEKKDLKRTKNGLAPDGNKLMIIYAKATKLADFERVLATYRDAKIVEGVGQKSVWSQQRKQLSLITDKNLIMHVNVEMKKDPKQRQAEMMARMQGKPMPKKKAETNDGNKEHVISIAKHVLNQL